MGASNGPLALVYGSADKYVIWHEALHLLGARDCYDTSDPWQNPGPTCELPNCLMQYAPTSEAVRDWPFLCQNNLDLIESRNK